MATTKWFRKAFVSGFNKETDFTSANLYCALFTDAHAPDQNVDQYYDAAHGMTEVANGNGYATGGCQLTNPAFLTAVAQITGLDSDNASWAAATFTCRYATVYDKGPAADKPFIAYVDFGANVSVTNGTLTITWDAAGICQVTVA